MVLGANQRLWKALKDYKLALSHEQEFHWQHGLSASGFVEGHWLLEGGTFGGNKAPIVFGLI